MKSIDSRRQGESGTQVVEFAIVVPLLAFLALLVSEGAGIVRAHQVINNAAREAAHQSAMPANDPGVNPNSITAVQTAAADYACFNNVQLVGGTTSACSTATYKPNVKCGTSGSSVSVNQAFVINTASGVEEFASQVTVTCSYPLSYLPALSFPWLGINIPNSIPLKTTATFRNFWGN
jgi:Flp pilus assembly protein TadG